MNPHTFRLRLSWKDGTTVGDAKALVVACHREIVRVYKLIPVAGHCSKDTWCYTFGFRERISADAMHDVCRAIFRFLRKRKELQGVGITDRTWWTPKLDPSIDVVDPIADVLMEPP